MNATELKLDQENATKTIISFKINIKSKIHKIKAAILIGKIQ